MGGKEIISTTGQVAKRRLLRRRLLTGLTAGAALLATGRHARAACALTVGQTEGPFYPASIGEKDWDLTRVSGGSSRAEGEVIEVTGSLLDAQCKPLPGSVVEVWQANAYGLYDHPRDRPRGRPRDPSFQGYARLKTDKDGAYRFLSIVPGAYPASSNWTRPPHIHFKAHPPSGPSLTTQMYFAGHPLNDKDLLLAPLAPPQRTALLVPFDRVKADGVRAGTFDLILAGA